MGPGTSHPQTPGAVVIPLCRGGQEGAGPSHSPLSAQGQPQLVWGFCSVPSPQGASGKSPFWTSLPSSTPGVSLVPASGTAGRQLTKPQEKPSAQWWAPGRRRRESGYGVTTEAGSPQHLAQSHPMTWSFTPEGELGCQPSSSGIFYPITPAPKCAHHTLHQPVPSKDSVSEAGRPYCEELRGPPGQGQTLETRGVAGTHPEPQLTCV